MIVAIDGPAGSGKTTTARRAAQELGFLYLDTGAMYRAIALGFIREDALPTDESARQVLPEMRVQVEPGRDSMRVFLDGDDVSKRIRRQKVGHMASKVSALEAVREKLLETQRREAREQVEKVGGVILDGRDIGTVVFPNADVKVFLVASAKERARRRQKELEEQGEDANFTEVLQEIERRDKTDRERAHAPLKRAEDATVLDTTSLSVDEQVQKVVDLVRERQAGTRRS